MTYWELQEKEVGMGRGEEGAERDHRAPGELSPRTHGGVQSIQAHPWDRKSHGVTKAGKDLRGHGVQPLIKHPPVN